MRGATPHTLGEEHRAAETGLLPVVLSERVLPFRRKADSSVDIAELVVLDEIRRAELGAPLEGDDLESRPSTRVDPDTSRGTRSDHAHVFEFATRHSKRLAIPKGSWNAPRGEERPAVAEFQRTRPATNRPLARLNGTSSG